MRLNNSKKAKFFYFLSSLILMTLFLGAAFFVLEQYRFYILGWKSVLLIIIPALLALIFIFSGRQIFEYDSDGEALNFRNRNVLTFFNKPVRDEFPKYKLLQYEFVNILIFKRLYITISSKKNNLIILKYDVSYLTGKELKDLKFSLSKVIKANQEREKNS
ncbi:hypothetical protein [Chryseobacterium koreense]|uniref:Uncharacterized protein n=1 Tax=Chryseobacterium koreense CCUG 49689 TaxID=1304281 RepID=A0A0J7J2H4_9FLAO|nr:hypothetical protein [Chryseobacterium koreense]KMQ72573.1 hypothetical protein ACM44_00280 [Chryseobacterium koreense CCUG 49689]MBB5332959.1 hypothetical protein [Chryseobacterium koreense]